MPRMSATKYRIHDVSVTRTEQGHYHHVRGHVFAQYPHSSTIIDRLDKPGSEYLDDKMDDLYDEDFLWGAAIQTARIQSNRRSSHPKRDRVLYRLLTLGVCDTPERFVEGESTRGRDVPTSLEMHHASAIGSRLLGRINVLEREVGPRMSLVMFADPCYR